MSKTSFFRTSNKRWTTVFIVAAIGLFGLSGWMWWHNIRSNPQRTLYAAIENNFRTTSLTRQITQTSGPQTLNQDIAVSFSPDAVARGYTTISQSGAVNAQVRTESVSTPNAEYVRYTKIASDQKDKKGKTLNYTKLLNIWGMTSSEATGQPSQLFGDSMLGVVPTATLQPRDRRALMETVKKEDVYKFDESKLERKVVNGRPVYTYDVTVEPVAYVTMLKQFGEYVGLKQLAQLQPEQFKDTQPLTFKLSVDVWSRHISAITYADAVRTEDLGSYGVRYDIELPKDSIPMQELQSKLQSVQ